MVFFSLCLLSLIIWYWQTYQKNVNSLKALGAKEGPSTKWEPFQLLWLRLQMALPFMWDTLRLVIAPYLIQKILTYFFGVE